MLKKILLLTLSLFLIQQSYNLLGNIAGWKTLTLGVSIFLGWVVNMYITGIFAFAGFALPTQKLLPESFYKINQPKKLKSLFKKLKGEWFRKFLLATVWRSKAQQAKYFDGTLSGIEHFETQSKKSEFGHLFPFIILTPVGIYLIIKGLVAFGVATLVFNILGNFYPILLQRHHRMRIDVLRRRMKRK